MLPLQDCHGGFCILGVTLYQTSIDLATINQQARVTHQHVPSALEHTSGRHFTYQRHHPATHAVLPAALPHCGGCLVSARLWLRPQMWRLRRGAAAAVVHHACAARAPQAEAVAVHPVCAALVHRAETRLPASGWRGTAAPAAPAAGWPPGTWPHSRRLAQSLQEAHMQTRSRTDHSARAFPDTTGWQQQTATPFGRLVPISCQCAGLCSIHLELCSKPQSPAATASGWRGQHRVQHVRPRSGGLALAPVNAASCILRNNKQCCTCSPVLHASEPDTRPYCTAWRDVQAFKLILKSLLRSSLVARRQSLPHDRLRPSIGNPFRDKPPTQSRFNNHQKLTATWAPPAGNT